ncbi:hypothetical protein E2C01_033909 [Portunus trituberculatus]|uniref:Uncharacterized protein n=1 Tax=Portunus trituberculatus TaxID=210409 RepID=A0A5B7F5H9_PORTR|nr:hypothetical protein [Portunus trituberculatus]
MGGGVTWWGDSTRDLINDASTRVVTRCPTSRNPCSDRLISVSVHQSTLSKLRSHSSQRVNWMKVDR